MCGIAGLRMTGRPSAVGLPTAGGGHIAPRDAVRRMVDVLRHRGPDDEGIVQVAAGDTDAHFGHTRLAIIDLSPDGHQPMRDPETGNWITYNGEIYNFRDVLAELGADDPGLSPWSRSDTEVILRAYRRWGRECVHRLRGMFAFALWDARKQELFLARDHLGIKPLYYYADARVFVFASEVRALLESGLVPRRLDRTGLWGYLAYQSVPAPQTLIRGVRMVPPGSALVVDGAGEITEHRYWDLFDNASEEARHASVAESRKRVRALLAESVGLHLVSDVPVGVFLSGGIDSSIVTGLMREQGHVPRTFSVVFAERAYSEAQHARDVARRFDTDHTEIALTEQALLDQLPDALNAMDQPSGDGVNTYVVSRAVRAAGLTVALSGLGGDEFFCGYPSFRRLARSTGLLRALAGTPAVARRLTAAGMRSVGTGSVTWGKIAALMESDGTLSQVFPIAREVLSREQRRRLLETAWAEPRVGARDPYVELLTEAFDRADGAGLLSQISYAEARTYMHDVLLRDADQVSMAHALEVRVPLLDHVLVEYVMGLPDAHKRSSRRPKALLVDSVEGLIPENIIRRPKQGFLLPFAPWMRGALREFCAERLGARGLCAREIFRNDRVDQLWRDFANGNERLWSRVWLLVVLEVWLARNGIEV